MCPKLHLKPGQGEETPCQHQCSSGIFQDPLTKGVSHLSSPVSKTWGCPACWSPDSLASSAAFLPGLTHISLILKSPAPLASLIGHLSQPTEDAWVSFWEPLTSFSKQHLCFSSGIRFRVCFERYIVRRKLLNLCSASWGLTSVIFSYLLIIFSQKLLFSLFFFPEGQGIAL